MKRWLSFIISYIDINVSNDDYPHHEKQIKTTMRYYLTENCDVWQHFPDTLLHHRRSVRWCCLYRGKLTVRIKMTSAHVQSDIKQYYSFSIFYDSKRLKIIHWSITGNWSYKVSYKVYSHQWNTLQLSNCSFVST